MVFVVMLAVALSQPLARGKWRYLVNIIIFRDQDSCLDLGCRWGNE